MLSTPAILPLPLAWIDFEFLPAWKALGLFALLGVPVLLLGLRSMAGLGPVRKWVAIGLRLTVLLLIVLILAGVRWQRTHKNVELLVLRDISQSTELSRNHPGKNLQDSIDDFLREASDNSHKPDHEDRIGVISFSDTPLIDSISNTSLMLDARAIRERGQSTDIASAIQMALATFQRDSMRRILLITDGNQTQSDSDLETAISAAASLNVPIDIMPLRYAVKDEVMVEQLVPPAWRRESDAAFDVPVRMVSTNPRPVSGTLLLTEEGQPIAKRAIILPPADVSEDGRIEPRKHVERFRVSALKARAVRRFKATFLPDHQNDPAAPGSTSSDTAGDTLLQNNSASAFTFIQGQGRVLYVDNSKDGNGRTLYEALVREGLKMELMTVDQVPEDLVQLQDYDAIVLNNVPRGRTPLGADGLSERHDAVLASYVHDFGGGLVMIGGPDSFGAGGWQGSKVEEVMPIDFDVPAQRQMPKGALVIVVHSCEMPNGNYWGEQCAIKAIEALSSRDDVGVISFGWNMGGGGVGGSAWNFPLGPKGDGSAPIAAVKKMQPGDMPSFDDTLQLALNGAGGAGAACLKNSNAAQKHVIIISDGDPSAPAAKLIQDYKQSKVSISTVSVYPHGPISPTMKQMAEQTGGRSYGPIEKNPSQLPQIFIKEATVVRRTLIQESKKPPIGVGLIPTASDIMKGISQPPPVYGFVLSTKKNNPTVEMPLIASMDGKKWDPLFAHWQAGLGKTAAFTSDAGSVWDEQWLGGLFAGQYGKFFAQMVRGVSRPAMPSDMSVNTERVGDKAIVTVEAVKKESGFGNFLNIRGVVVDPDGKQRELRLVQTGPGTYVGEFPVSKEGNYVAALRYTGPDGQAGWLPAGLSVNDSPEMRELRSNDALLEEIARRTRGRVIRPFDVAEANLFTRENLPRSSSPLPIWDILLPILMGLILIDVAARRIAWDWNSSKKAAAAVANYVRSFTTTRTVEAKPTLDALRKVREEVAETRFKPIEPVAVPDRSAKFEAKGVEGDITQVVGGATAKPIPSASKDPKPKGAPLQGHTSSLLEAKRRAQQKIREKEQGE